MTTEVSAVQTANTEKVYSNDGKIYLGMTVEEAKSDPTKMQIFTSADVVKDNVISPDELARYNGPTITETYASGKSVSFYPGLELDKVKEEGKATFSKIDKNQDKKLSLAEMNEAKMLEEKINKDKQSIEKYSEANLISKIIAPLAGGWVALSVGLMASSVGVGLVMGSIVGLMLAGIGLLGNHIAHNNMKDTQKFVDETDNQYGQYLVNTKLKPLLDKH